MKSGYGNKDEFRQVENLTRPLPMPCLGTGLAQYNLPCAPASPCNSFANVTPFRTMTESDTKLVAVRYCRPDKRVKGREIRWPLFDRV